MAGDEGNGGVHVAVGDRNAGIGQPARGSGDSRNDPKGNTSGNQGQCFLATAAASELLGLMDIPFLLFAIAPLFELIVNQPYPWILRRFRRPERALLMNQILDIVAITWGNHFIGGMNMFVGIPSAR